MLTKLVDFSVNFFQLLQDVVALRTVVVVYNQKNAEESYGTHWPTCTYCVESRNTHRKVRPGKDSRPAVFPTCARSLLQFRLPALCCHHR